MTPELVPDRYRLHAEICKVLTDPKRLMLLEALRDGERTVGELADSLGITLPNASQHLGVMRGAGLVEGRREGPVVRYRLAEPAILEACDIVGGIVRRRLARHTEPDLPVLAGRTGGTVEGASL
jgi:ArsR family transcriptional regulator, virulence genes transcriptional regulator